VEAVLSAEVKTGEGIIKVFITQYLRL
jgi:hypothetical protein